MSSGLNLVPQAVGQARPQLIHATVSTSQPPPTDFTSPLYVVLPHRSQHYEKITDWFACHGASLPQPGADCVIYFDDQRTLRCLWWDGTYTPPTGYQLGLARGTATLTFTSSPQAAQLSVFHGLGSTPTAVTAAVTASSAVTDVISVYPGNYDPKHFTVNATASGALTASLTVAWIASI